jgi:hypothetical protein
VRQGGLAGQPVGVVAGGGEQLGSADRSDPGSGQRPGCGLPDDVLDVAVIVADLGVKMLPAAGQGGQGQAGAVGAIRIWGLYTGNPYGNGLTGPATAAESIAITTIDGRALVVSGHWDGTIWTWNP